MPLVLDDIDLITRASFFEVGYAEAAEQLHDPKKISLAVNNVTGVWEAMAMWNAPAKDKLVSGVQVLPAAGKKMLTHIGLFTGQVIITPESYETVINKIRDALLARAELNQLLKKNA